MAAPRAPAGWLGVMADGPLTEGGAPAREWGRLDASGAGTVRVAFYWSDLEPRPGEHDWSAADDLVAQTADRGMRLLPVVLRAPEWARDGDQAAPPRDPADYARFLQAAVARYGPQGTFWAARPDVRRIPVRTWQVWNEPDLQEYWSVRPFAETYVALLREAAAAIRAADAGAQVVLAGLTNRSWEALEEVYAAGGQGHFDAVALHPYTRYPRNVPRVVDYGREVMARYGDAAKPVWVTELSFPATHGHTGLRVQPSFGTTDTGMAKRLKGAVRRLARARKRLNIAGVVWYTWISAYAGTEWPDYSGLRRVRGSRVVGTPALRAFRRVARDLRR